MGKDWPDWGATYNNAAFFPLSDDAELAARLGSIMRYDRRGTLIWQEDFTFGLDSVFIVGSKVGWSKTLRVLYYVIPPFACELVSPSGLDEYVAITNYSPIPNCKRVGYSGFYMTDGSIYALNHYLSLYEENKVYDASARLVSDTDYHVYINTNAGEVDVWEYSEKPLFNNSFQFIKLVIDIDTKYYERLIVGRREIDLTDYPIPESASEELDLIGMFDFFYGVEGSSVEYYIDNLILTANEPANA